MNFSPKRSTAILLLVLTALLWSTGGFLIKGLSMNALAVAGYRSLISGLVFIVLRPRRPFRVDRWRLLGGLAYALTVMSFVSATKLTTAANAILLQYTAPVWIVLLSMPLLRERVFRRDIVTVLLVLGGMVLFLADGLSAGNNLGNLIAIFSGLCFGCTAMFLRKVRDASPFDSVLLGNFITVILCLPWMFSDIPSVSELPWLLALGVFQLGISYVLYTMAIQRVSALEAILIPILEPLLNPVWVLLVTGEKPGLLALAGGAVVLGAVTVNCVLAARKTQPADTAAEAAA